MATWGTITGPGRPFTEAELREWDEGRRRWAQLRGETWAALQAGPPPAGAAVTAYLDKFCDHATRIGTILALYDAGRLTPATLGEALASGWTHGGYPADLGPSRLLALFKAAGFVTDTPGVTRPAAPLAVFRGTIRFAPRGLCWTTNLGTAQWFAARLPAHAAAVLSATVPPHGVLGIFHDRGEHEIVVNPRTLRGIQQLPPLTEADRQRVADDHARAQAAQMVAARH